MVRIYTRGGDRGETALWGGRRVPKHDPRVEAYGSVDELNATLGLARAALAAEDLLHGALARIQHELFEVGAELADPAGHTKPRIGSAQVERLEHEIDAMDAQLPPLTRFVLPGGCEPAARLHLARTVARRAERRVVALAAAAPVNPDVVRYLNRLSDWLFVAARLANQRRGDGDVLWEPGGGAGEGS